MNNGRMYAQADKGTEQMYVQLHGRSYAYNKSQNDCFDWNTKKKKVEKNKSVNTKWAIKKT